jgi:hypothetical protein
LDCHTDGADIAVLTRLNVARLGGMSMASNSTTAHNILVSDQPELVGVLRQKFYFNRHSEQVPDEEPTYPNPINDEAWIKLFGKGNRNRMISARQMAVAPRLRRSLLRWIRSIASCGATQWCTRWI